jgi:hypothetical protein
VLAHFFQDLRGPLQGGELRKMEFANWVHAILDR